MKSFRFVSLLLAIAFMLATCPAFGADVTAQLNGTVKDSTGAIVPNATVEASSDVLIERVRTVTTNGEGRYAIIDLRPGTYVVTVSLQGFAPLKQTVIVPSNVSRRSLCASICTMSKSGWRAARAATTPGVIVCSPPSVIRTRFPSARSDTACVIA